ncbi:MAG: hypothetical protein FVQ79_03870 [Planctomycetes bacterium]|nr:hypothetical protein [Planctomycetota bacterium]
MTLKADQTNIFDKIGLSNWQLFVNRNFAKNFSTAPLLSEYIYDIRGPFTPVAASKFARVFRCKVNFASHEQDLFFKQYLYRSPIDFLKHIFRPSRAKRAAAAAIMLAQHGLSTPEIIAIGQLKIAGLAIKTFVITRTIENAKDLYACIEEVLQAPVLQRHKFLTDLGTTIGTMHNAGIFHGDLRPGNVMVRIQDGNWKFYFLDNERTKKFAQIPEKLRLKNLIQINMIISDQLTAADRMRFYKSYRKAHTTPIQNQKQLAINTAQKTAQRLEKKLQ